MPTSVTIAALAALTTVGLVGAAVTDGGPSIAWAIGTVVVAVLFALQLRSAPRGTFVAAGFFTAVAVLSAGVPATLLLTDGPGATSYGAEKEVEPGSASPVADPSAQLRAAVAKADEIQPGGSNSLLEIDIDENTTRVTTLDLTTGQRVSAYFSQRSDEWDEPSRHSTTDRADATFRAADIAGLDLTAAAKKVTAAADTIKLDRTNSHASDGIEIERRSPDKKLVATFSLSGFDIEVDSAGGLPDNLALATVDGLLPIAERLLRANGLDPAQPVLDQLDYRVFAENVSSVGSGRGTVELRVDGGGKYGTLKETVGKFPEVQLKPDTSPSSTSFALRAITPAGIEKARADLEQRFSVLPIDAHALGLRVDADTRTSSRITPPTIMQVGLGPNSDHEAYYAMNGTFLRTG